MKRARTTSVLLAISIAGIISSCATKYVPLSLASGIETGYTETKLDSTTWQVMFVANRTTEMAIVNRYMLYRAAELTSQRGFDYFLILDYQNSTKGDSAYMENPPQFVSLPDPNGRLKPYQLSGPRMQFITGSHSAVATIQMMRGICPPNNIRAYPAHSMLATMGPTIER